MENNIKNTFTAWLLLFPLLMGAVCNQSPPHSSDGDGKKIRKNTDSMSDILLIKVGDKEFIATLLDNPSATAFKAMLPLRINMIELNGNEKYFRLSKNLPINAFNPGTINSGDLMLWGSNTLVLFYKTFSTSYSYTKVGRIDDVSGLTTALGTGNVIVTMKLK